jgi:phosphoribosyl-dephospho-CoA transferase
MLDRHNLAWLSDDGWQCAFDRAAGMHRDSIAAWRRCDLPVIVRRADADADIDEACLGLALPPSPIDGSKTRIALRVPRSAVKKWIPPLPVVAVIQAAPCEWRTGLAALDTQARQHGLLPRVYGSLALQALTGHAYVMPSSDIDLLFHAATTRQLHAAVDLLSSMSDELPLDGEIVFPSGDAVAWKEWHAATGARNGTRVLVKGRESVRLAATSALLSTLDQPCLT